MYIKALASITKSISAAAPW